MMFKISPRIARQLPITALATALTFAAGIAHAQVKVLRSGDDQFIQQLREQGMSDLLQHFVETAPPEDPISRLALDVALKEFVADDLLARASAANMDGNTAEALNLFEQSRQTFEEVIAAQRKLVEDHKDDERLPIWQTDLAEMLITRYLPRYYQRISWHYEFGQPNPEHAKAFEGAMVEALKATSDATYRIGLLPNRVGNDPELREKLEEMGIWYRLEDYGRINTPYWLGHAAHSVTLLPDDHEYFKARDVVRNQRAEAKAEKNRLRNRVIDSFNGPLDSDERTALTAKLIRGRTLAWSGDVDDNDDAVDLYLDKAIKEGDGTERGYLAKLAKAVARWNAGETDTALDLLSGMENDNYVKADGTVVSRLLAADLVFKIKMKEAGDALPSEQPPLIAKAYELAYLPLIGDDQDPRFKDVLFGRWADSAEEGADPSTLPATVRMGIGERLTQQGGAQAQMTMAELAKPAPAVPNELDQWKANIKTLHDSAKSLLEKAAAFNNTLIGEEMEGTVLANGLYNLGMNTYWLAKLATVYDPDAANKYEPLFEAYKLWVQVPARVPEADRAQNALIFALGQLQLMDIFFNSKEIQKTDVRESYAQAFGLMNELWPGHELAHNNRVYAGFQLYEKTGKFDEAIAVYRALPPEHKDYFQARRQMIYVMHRDFKGNADELRLLEATAPNEEPPAGAAPDEVEKLKQDRVTWERRRDAVEEKLTRLRSEIVDDAELIIIDAEDVIEGGRTPALRFTSATASGAATVVLSGMRADAGETKKSLALLEGFESKFDPKEGKYAQLAALQTQPESALTTLQGLVQTCQQQRIMSLLDAGQTQEMAKQAQVMMNATPDVAAAVVAGVLDTIESQIAVQERIKRDAPFKLQRDRADEQVKFLAKAAVDLGKLLVQWATNTQGKSGKDLIPYQLPLAESLMLAGQPQDALKIMQPIVKAIPNNFNISMQTGKTYIAVFKQTKDANHYNGANKELRKIIEYYNRQNDKPTVFWEAWYHYLRLLEAAGGNQASEIPGVGRMLKGIDEEFGGPAYKEKIMDLIDRNGGIERVQPRPSSATPSGGVISTVQPAAPNWLLPVLLIGLTGLICLMIVLAKPFLARRPH